jgi:colicin import membrane protein
MSKNDDVFEFPEVKRDRGDPEALRKMNKNRGKLSEFEINLLEAKKQGFKEKAEKDKERAELYPDNATNLNKRAAKNDQEARAVDHKISGDQKLDFAYSNPMRNLNKPVKADPVKLTAEEAGRKAAQDKRMAQYGKPNALYASNPKLGARVQKEKEEKELAAREAAEAATKAMRTPPLSITNFSQAEKDKEVAVKAAGMVAATEAAKVGGERMKAQEVKAKEAKLAAAKLEQETKAREAKLAAAKLEQEAKLREAKLAAEKLKLEQEAKLREAAKAKEEAARIPSPTSVAKGLVSDRRAAFEPQAQKATASNVEDIVPEGMVARMKREREEAEAQRKASNNRVPVSSATKTSPMSGGSLAERQAMFGGTKKTEPTKGRQ